MHLAKNRLAPLILTALLAAASGCDPGVDEGRREPREVEEAGAVRVQEPELPPVDSPRLDGVSVLLISIDTLRADHLAPYGAEIDTPTASRLAAEGVTFERAVAQAPLTLPSHTSLFTGLYPPGHGVRDNGGFEVDPAAITLAERLREAGYQTAAFVGAYVLDSSWGLDQGFDTYDDRFAYAALEGKSLNEVERPADEVVEPALRWLRQERDEERPFFLWLHLYDPHDPYEPPARYAENASSDYAGEVTWADEQAGRLVAALDDTGLRDRTLVAYLSDHGEGLGDHGERTHSIFIYGATVDVPLIVAPPAGDANAATLLPAGERVASLARLVDVSPTILDLLGQAPLESVDGSSLLPAVAAARAGPVARSDGLAQSAAGAANAATGLEPSATGPSRPGDGPGQIDDGGDAPVLTGPVSYAESFYPRFHYGWSELVSLETARWRYIHAPKPELYDLREDPEEVDDLHARRPEVAAALRSELERLGLMPSGAAPQRAAVDAEARERLRSLGYLGGGTGDAATDATADDGPLPDPKDMLPLLQDLQRAQRLESAGRLTAARDLLQELTRRDPANPDVHFALASVNFKMENWQRAIEAGQRVLELSPDYPIAIHNLALAYQAAGRVDEAVVGFERVLELEPDNVKALLNLGEIWYGRGDLAEAARYYARAARAAPGLATVHVNRGNILLEMGRMEEAREALRRAVELGEESPYLHFNLALIAEQRGDRREALRRYRAEVEANPGTFKAWINLGLLHREAGDLEAALTAFERGAAAGPEEMAGAYLAAETAAALGRIDDARRWAREAAERSPDDPRVRQLLERLGVGDPADPVAASPEPAPSPEPALSPGPASSGSTHPAPSLGPAASADRPRPAAGAASP